MNVSDLIVKLQTMPQDAEVFIQDAGTGIMGSELTGCMGYQDEPLEDVRKIEEGVMLCHC